MHARQGRMLGFGLFAAVVLALGLVLGGIARGAILYGDATGARDALRAVVARLDAAGAGMTAADVTSIGTDLSAADDRLASLEAALAGDPLVRLARAVPAADVQLAAATRLLRAGRFVTSRHDEILALLQQYVVARDSASGLQRLAAYVRLAGSAREQIADLAGAVQAADDLAGTIPSEGLAGPLADARALVTERLSALRPLADEAVRALDLVATLAGLGGARRYLVLALDNAETRPVGGLIGAFATPSFRNGLLTDLSFRDILSIDLPDQVPYVEPPPGLKEHLLGRFPWQVADAGWWPDWSENVAEIRRLYTIETGDQDIQGVIAFTPEVVDRLLEIVGPVNIPEAGVTVRAGETYLVSLEQVEVLHQGEGRKAFLAELASEVLARILALPPSRLVDVLRALDAAALRRQLQVSLDDPAAEAMLAESGWVSSFTFPSGADRLAVMDTNVAPVSKLNAITTLAHRLEVSLGPDGAAGEVLRTTYQNRFGPDMGPALNRVRSTFFSGNLGAYQRRYLDPRATVVAVSSDGQPALSAPEREAVEDGCLVVGNYLLVRPGTTTIETRYRVPAIVSTAGGDPAAAGTYRLHFVKEPGRDRDVLTVVVRTPPGTRPVSWSDGGVIQDGTVVFEATTEFDRDFVVSYGPA